MLLSLVLSRKNQYLRLVSRRLWTEAAIWPTAKSGLKGWRLTQRGFMGFLHTNPLFGLSLVLYLGGHK